MSTSSESFADLQDRLRKPRPRALEKKDRAKRKRSVEDRENATVKARSKGQCEIRESLRYTDEPRTQYAVKRCPRRASQIHHMLGGTGRRGVGESALADNKLHCCDKCHNEVTRHILQQHWTQVEDRAGTSYFVRLK